MYLRLFAIVTLFATAACGDPPANTLFDIGPGDGGPGPDLLSKDLGPVDVDAFVPPDGAFGDAAVPDTFGPTIAPMFPVAGSYIGGYIQISVNITDGTAVDDATVRAVWTHKPNDPNFNIPLVRTQGDTFTAVFNAGLLGKNLVFPTLSIRADDVLGNHAEKGIDVIVDNTRPVLSLDPPLLRIGKVAMGLTTCSALFDPVGEEAASDGKLVEQVVTLRARIEDFGNDAPGLLVPRISKLDPNSTYLFASPVANGPLVVDVDGDGTCDAINPALVPISPGMGMTTSNQALSLVLVAMPPAGQADFFTPTTKPVGCDVVQTAQSAPDPLCFASGSLMTIAIPSHDDNVGLASIFTIPPVAPADQNCTGLQLDTLNNLPEGPACVAVTARDSAGNLGVSRPIRVCIDRGGGACAAWPPAVLPECTGTAKAGIPATTACTAPTFAAGEILEIN